MAKKSSDKGKTEKRGTADFNEKIRKLGKIPVKKSGKKIDTIIDTLPPPDSKPEK